MPNNTSTHVPVWALTTREANAPALLNEATMTPERLSELRTVLAAMADAPIATLEVHPIPRDLDRSGGIHLDSASPLAQHLSQLISKAPKTAPAVSASAGGEALYRMVVPAKHAAQVSSGALKPMASKAAAGGIHGALTNSSGIVAQATFVPAAGQAAAAGAATGSAATAGVAAASAGALTVAAPLILMAVAVGVSAHAEHKRQQALERITELLEKIHEDKLETERNQLDGCRDAIDKATAILLDQGRPGASLGLDSAVHVISTAMEASRRRLKRWQQAIADLPREKVEVAALRKSFPGIDEPGGEFRAHLELATLAIALKRRVIVLQAVEHSQSDPSNPFESFVKALKADAQRVDELEFGIADVLRLLSRVELTSSRRILDKMVSAGDVNKLLSASYRLRALGDEVDASRRASDVAIDIARDRDGSLVVLPAVAV